MKKYFLLFAASGIITLASCGGDTAPAETLNVDSIAAVKADSIAAALKAESDSTIAAMAAIQADSIAAAEAAAAVKSSSTKSSAKKPATKSPAPKTEVLTPAPAPVPETIGNGKPKLNESKSDNTIGNGKPKLGSK